MPATERTGCPSHEQLAAFSLGNVTEQALETIAGHLETCTRCASALSTVRDGGDSLLGGLRRPTSAEQFLDEPEYRQAVERVQGIGYAPAPSDRRDAETLRPIPRELGRYEILEELGCGGMGTVYLARDTLLRREVALKIPHFRRSDEPRRLERFYREARAAATLDHPNLCPVYDVGETDEIPYLSMARIKGKSLAKLLKQRERFSQREAAEIVRQVALAVEEAHAGGIVHRDIKPSNIMLTDEGEPILTDFGLAQRLELEDPRLTRSGVIVGTPSYMAPEQVEGDPETLGPACDVYSLGVVLYELLTGRVPFEGPLLSVLKQLGEDPPTAPSAHRPDVDRRLEAICLKALAKDPAGRYRSAGALAEALEQYLAGWPQSAAPPSRRRRLIWGSAAGAAALVLALAAVITVVTNRGTLEIRTFDEDVKVSVLKNGQEVEIVDTKTNKRVTLHAGRYELRLSDGKPGLWLSTNRFRLRRGDKVVVEVRAPVNITRIPDPSYKWHPYRGHLYTLTKKHGPWQRCEEEAVALGGHLAAIDDADENQFLTKTFADATTWKWRKDPDRHHPAHLAWIGLYAKGSVWEWTNGQQMTWDPIPWWRGLKTKGDRAYLHVGNHPEPGTWWYMFTHNINPEFYPRGIIEIVPPE